jgi:hypothetical protein
VLCARLSSSMLARRVVVARGVLELPVRFMSTALIHHPTPPHPNSNQASQASPHPHQRALSTLGGSSHAWVPRCYSRWGVQRPPCPTAIQILGCSTPHRRCLSTAHIDARTTTEHIAAARGRARVLLASVSRFDVADALRVSNAVTGWATANATVPLAVEDSARSAQPTARIAS